MKVYSVIVSFTGYTLTCLYTVNDIDEVYECMAWNHPDGRIIGADAIQRVE